MSNKYGEPELFHGKNGDIWKKVYEILERTNGRPPNPDEMQDAWEDYLGQEFED